MRILFLLSVHWTILLGLRAVNGKPQPHKRQKSGDEDLLAEETLFKRAVKLTPRANRDYCGLIGQVLRYNKDKEADQRKAIPILAVRECYKTFPYDSEQAEQTVGTASKLLDMYAFLDYNNGKPPLKIDPNKVYSNEREKMEAGIDDKQVDVSSTYKLKEGVDKIGKNKYKTDFEFQEALSRALIPARDGHLSYNPQCYRMFTFIQPVFLTTRLKNKKLEIILGGIDKGVEQPDEESLGKTVAHIDGVETIKYLVDFAKNEYGRSRSAPTRFARVLTTVNFDSDDNNFRYERGDFARRTRLPEKDSVTYGFLDSKGKVKNVTIPWFVLEPDEFEAQNSNDYWEKYCKSKTADQDAANVIAQNEQLRGNTIHNMIVEKGQEFKNSDNKVETKGDNIKEKISEETDPIVSGPEIGFFILREKDGSKFGVISVPSFSVEPANIGKWATALVQGLGMFKKNNIDQILVDFSNNGGGNICLSHALSRTLSMAESKFSFPYPAKLLDSRVRVNSILEMLCKSSIAADKMNVFTPAFFNYIDKDGEMQNCPKDMTWGSAEKAEKEELRLRASPTIVERCTGKELLALLEPLKTIKMWTSNVYLLTNGYCGSACATSLAMLRYQDHLVVHFRHKTPCFDMKDQECNSKAPFSFAGGQVLDSNGIFGIARELKLIGKPGFPRPFMVNANMNFAYRAMIDRQYPLDLMHWDRNYIIMEPGYSQMLRIDYRWKESLRVAKEYAKKLKRLLDIRKNLRLFEAKLDDLEKDSRQAVALHEKATAECEANQTSECVAEVNALGDKINGELIPNLESFSEKYNNMVKQFLEQSKKESEEFGKDWK